jgi:NSS family neurotransmitter:Na+ symporter
VAQAREHWGTRSGFILATAGSMIGLGNIWRFPYVAYDNGGGAFMIPYLVALLTAGIPLLILEFAIGHRTRSSPPAAFRKLSGPSRPLGWWQVAICFVVAAYYAVVIAWAIRYMGFSVTLQWGRQPERFLFEDFLQVADEPGSISSYVSGVVGPLIAVWVITTVVLVLGVRRGIELVNKVCVPLLIVLFSILVVRSLFLNGAGSGLEALLKPDWTAIGDASVWLAAYGQIFFTLSVGFGIMITYASYVRRNADLTGSALVAAFANSSFEILAGIGVFAALGFMSTSQGVPVEQIADQGIGLAFIAFPQIISTLPAGAHIFGLLFFGSLVLAGLTSLISIVQVVVAAVQDRLGWSRHTAVLSVSTALGGVSIALFPTDQGLYYLDVVDHFILEYGISLAALVSIVIVAWLLRKLPEMRRHANATSAVHIGWSWMLALGVATPLALGWIIVEAARTEFAAPYGDYPQSFVNTLGWGVAGAAILVAIVASLPPWRRPPQLDTITFQKGRR